ncbi:MAG: amino acid ABC transporter permease [Bacteriovoracaceae bacterium]
MSNSIDWFKKNLFNGWLNSVLTVVCFYLVIKFGAGVIQWLFIDSVWEGTSQTCRQADGACLVFIKEKFLFILFGFYPREIIWRPITGVFIFCLLLFLTMNRKFWSKKLIYGWFLSFIVMAILLKGGVLGFVPVDSDKWGGLPLTLILATVGLIFSYPLGILLALGRRSEMPIIKSFSVIYIEIIRGVPLISVLFMSSVVFPLFLPEGMVINKVFRAQVAIIMFISAYMAEVVRGGLQAIPKGQYEAAQALGLGYWQSMVKIILPQALRVVIPPTVNTAIGMFKDTSLVIIIALFDLMYTTKASLQDPNWLGFTLEAYAFVACIYFIFCFSMSRFSQRLEADIKSKQEH